MLRHDFIRKVISKMPEIVLAKRFNYQALEDDENIYIYRIPFMEEKELFTTIPKATKDIPATWINHIYHGNQFYDEYGTPKAGGSNGRYPGCGFGGTKKNNFWEQGKTRQKILFLC